MSAQASAYIEMIDIQLPWLHTASHGHPPYRVSVGISVSPKRYRNRKPGVSSQKAQIHTATQKSDRLTFTKDNDTSHSLAATSPPTRGGGRHGIAETRQTTMPHATTQPDQTLVTHTKGLEPLTGTEAIMRNNALAGETLTPSFLGERGLCGWLHDSPGI